MSRKRIVKRAQIGRDFFLQIARQKTERFAGFDRRPRQNNPADLFLLQRRHGHRHGEIGLARAGRPDAEDDVVFLNRFDIIALAGVRGTIGGLRDEVTIFASTDVAQDCPRALRSRS